MNIYTFFNLYARKLVFKLLVFAITQMLSKMIFEMASEIKSVTISAVFTEYKNEADYEKNSHICLL